MRRLAAAAAGLALLPLLAAAQETRADFLGWTARQAESIGRESYRRGRIGGRLDTRLLKTERSYNYKLAGTWLTSETIRASARLAQLRSRLSNEETLALVREADGAADTVIMVEIDPREGSGVIPNDWEAFLQPADRPSRAVRGTVASALRDVPGLAGVLRRNYDYDRFWVTFPLSHTDGAPLFTSNDQTAVLVVRIQNQEGRVEWPVPPSIRERDASPRSAAH